MMSFNKFITLAISILLVSTTASAQSLNAVKVPLNTFTKPASDLILNGKELNYSDLTTLWNQKFDLSKINPVENKYWQDKKYPAIDLGLHRIMPAPDAGVVVDSYLGANRELGIFSVVIKTALNERYILTIGQQVHSSLLKSALLRKMGYYQEAPKYYPRIKINFKNKDEKDEFINTTFCENGPSELATDCLSISPFKSSKNPKEYLSHAGGNSLYAHGIYLEKMNPEVPSLFDGLTPATQNSLPYFSTSRAFRALVVPFVIGDMGESLNRVSTQPVFNRAGWANIDYAFAHYFSETSPDDIRWGLRRLSQLSDADWDEIVDASEYPKSLKPLVKSLVLLRYKQFNDAFFTSDEKSSFQKINIPNLNYSSNDGYVKNGKVVVESIPGYPQRFSNGDRQSPFESGDFLRYLKIKGLSSTIELAVMKLENILHQQNTIPLHTKIKGWEVSDKGVKVIGSTTGLNVGNNFSASRILTTGTYYESQAPIQLVDTISVSTSLGVMHAVADLGNINKLIGTNVQYSREYTHVKPLNSIKESSTVSWADVQVASKLRSVGKFLRDDLKDKKTKEKIEPNANQFLNNLRPGEVFLITDSVSMGAQGGVEVGLDSLIGINTGMVSPTVGLSAGGAKVILRQIQIIKTDDGLQVLVRNQNTKAFNIGIDVNYFINLLKIKNENLRTDLHTDAFVLNYNNEFMTKAESGEIDVTNNDDLKTVYDQEKDFGKKLASALRGIIFQSSIDSLYSEFNFQRFDIDHKIKTNMLQTKLLWYRATQLNESHLLTIQKPEIKTPEGTTVVNEPIQIVVNRQGALHGRDVMGFALDGVDAFTSLYLKSYAPQLSQSSQNPTQMPFGKAEWRIVKTETEVTQSRVGALPTVATIQHVWGGWSLKKNKLNTLIKNINERLSRTEYSGSELIPDHTFRNVTKLDFFKVTSNLVLLPPAIEKVKKMISNPTYNVLNLEPNKLNKLTRLSKKYSTANALDQNKILNSVIYLIDDKVELGSLLKFFGKENYLYFIEISGFRTGDENADQGVYISHVIGEPDKKETYASGLLGIISTKSKVISTELDRTQSSFQ